MHFVYADDEIVILKIVFDGDIKNTNYQLVRYMMLVVQSCHLFNITFYFSVYEEVPRLTDLLVLKRPIKIMYNRNGIEKTYCK